MLETTDAEFGLLSDIDMLLFCEKAIRGVLNGVGALRHFRALKKYLQKFDRNEKFVFGAIFVVASLYGGVMVRKLPRDGYKWCEIKNIVELMGKYRSNTDFGYFVEIDLEYPREIHDDHSDFPLAPEKLVIKDDCLSAYSENLVSNRSVVPKSSETLFDKPNYICHIEKTLENK